MEYQYQGLKVSITENSTGKPFIRIFNQDGYPLSAFGVFNPDKSKEMADAAAEHLSRYLKKLGVELPAKIACPIAALCAEQDRVVANEMIKVANALPTDAFWNQLAITVDDFYHHLDTKGRDDSLSMLIRDLMLAIRPEGHALRPEPQSKKINRRRKLIRKLDDLSAFLSDSQEFEEITLSSLVRLSEYENNRNDQLIPMSLSTVSSETTLQKVLELLALKLTSDIEHLDDGALIYTSGNRAVALPLIWGDLVNYRSQPGTKGAPSEHNLTIRILCNLFNEYTGQPRFMLVAHIMCALWPKWEWEPGESPGETLNRWNEQVKSVRKDYQRLNKQRLSRGG